MQMKTKKSLTIVALLAGAVSVYSQEGQISMTDYMGGFAIQVFAPQGGTVPVSYGGYSGYEVMGNSGNGYSTSPGSATYLPTSALGNGYSVQLIIAGGRGDALSALSPAGPVYSTWIDPTAGDPFLGKPNNWDDAGFWNAFGLVNFGSPGEAVTVAVAVWDNEGGTVNSVAAAQAAGDPWGVSNTGNDTLTGGRYIPANLPATIESFSLASNVVPEPGTIALGVMGASAFLFRRRK
jgi:hypothetical protein